MSILITGGTGFLGSTLAGIIMDHGQRPVLLDPAPPRGALRERDGAYDYVAAGLSSLPVLIDTMRQYKVETVYHLGGMLSMPCERNPWLGLEVNVGGTQNVLEAARLEGVGRLVFASSVAVYGQDLPEAAITDQSLQRPTSLYGLSKVHGELLGRFYHRRFGLDFRGLRIPSVVGPGSKVPHMSIYNSWAIEKPLRGEAYEILVEPETRCPTIYYKDTARALWLLGQAPAEAVRTRVYNVAGPSPAFSAGELAEAVRGRLPQAELAFRPDPEVSALLATLGSLPLDDANARGEWGWAPQYDLPAMVDDFIAEFRANTAYYN